METIFVQGHLPVVLSVCIPLLLVTFVMLLTLKEDSTTGGFYLYHLLHVLGMNIKSGAICKSVHLYTIFICTYCMAVYMCPCIKLALACAIDY